MSTSAPPPEGVARPPWARPLDRWAARAARWLGWLVRRPDDDALERLARADRGPRPELPRPEGVSVPPGGIDAARAALDRGELAEALHLFGEILAVDERAAWAWHGRGDALQLMGAWQDALAAYERATELQPRVGLHHGGRANALKSLGRVEEAEAAWTEALRLDPGLEWMRRG